MLRTARFVFLGLAALSFFSVPLSVRAASVSPEKNPLCWSEGACKEQYKLAGWEKSFTQGTSWLKDTECGGSWGRCVPPGKAQLSIAFRGTTEVKDMGSYIKLIYAFLVGIAGVIAVVLIVKGGFEYMTAAGSSERITSAKNTVGSAVLGLLLVFGSYTLLNTINPDLVNLRLPNVYMVRKIVLGADWCKDVSDDKKLAEANVAYKDVVNLPGNWNVSKQETVCGKDYWIPNGDSKTCKGQWCKEIEGKANVCLKVTNKYTCVEGILSGEIISSTVPFPYIDNKLMLFGVCNEDGKKVLIETINVEKDSGGKKLQNYVFKSKPEDVKSKVEKECSKGVKGFFIGGEVNDEGSVTGSGCDDWFAIGRSGGSSCNINLSKVLLGKPTTNVGWACSLLSYMKTGEPPYNAVYIPNANLIPLDELLKGTSCNISLDRGEFPALINSIKSYLIPVPACDLPDPTSCFHIFSK